jgi:hypothetical protein
MTVATDVNKETGEIFQEMTSELDDLKTRQVIKTKVKQALELLGWIPPENKCENCVHWERQLHCHTCGLDDIIRPRDWFCKEFKNENQQD